ncbi:hypothetical protein Tco_1162816 [Tanacetum coccineum]
MAERALRNIKEEVGKLPTLVIPKEDETITMCLLPKSETINVVLSIERNGCKSTSTICLRRYFKNHKIKVVKEGLIEQALRNPGAIGRLTLWEVELGTYVISYVPKETTKGRVVTKFLTDEKQESRA